MIEGIRHTGIVVNNLQKASEFYLALGCKVKAKANEEGRFIEKVTGIKNVNIEWIKMVFDDGNLLELIQYNNPKKEKNLNQYTVLDKLLNKKKKIKKITQEF